MRHFAKEALFTFLAKRRFLAKYRIFVSWKRALVAKLHVKVTKVWLTGVSKWHKCGEVTPTFQISYFSINFESAEILCPNNTRAIKSEQKVEYF